MKKLYVHHHTCSNTFELAREYNAETDKYSGWVKDKQGNVRSFGTHAEAVTFAKKKLKKSVANVAA